MITNQGQNQLLKMVAGKTKFFADLFAVGISDKALTDTATQMDFGWATCPITASYVDLELNQVVFHGTLDKGLAGDIKEIGLISQSDEFIRSGLPNSVVYTFDPNENWVSENNFEVTAVASIGNNTLKITDVVSGSTLFKAVSSINVSRYDTIKVKVNSESNATIKMSLKNDELRYASAEINLTQGDQIVELALSGLTKTGAFDPKDIMEINFEFLAVQSGSAINFDAISFFSKENGGLVARSPLAMVQYKRYGSSMELEYAVGF